MNLSEKFLLGIFLLSSTVNIAYAADFSDIEDHVYEEAIDIITEDGIVDGYSDNTFRPDAFVNRAELMKMVTNPIDREGLPNSCSSYGNFLDVNTDDWYAKYICRGLRDGHVKGYDDGYFRPGQYVTFVEALKIVMQTASLEYEETGNFWYEWSVRHASDLNIIPLDVEAFNQQMTRAQIAEMIVRVNRYTLGELDEYLGSNSNKRVRYEDLGLNQGEKGNGK